MLTILFWALALGQAKTPAPAATLEAQLRQIVASSGAEISIAYRTLDGRRQISHRRGQAFHAASTMKVPVMIELFRQAAAGELSLDDPLPDPQRVPQHRRRQPVTR